MADYREWRRVVKLDPARVLTDERLAAVCDWGPDALVVGGTGGYGADQVLRLLGRLRPCGLPLALEISDAAALLPGFDVYLVPMVLNTDDARWVIGRHREGIKRFAHQAQWERLVVEGYCILNAQATAAQLTQAETGLERDDVVALALLAEHLLKLPLFYLEYSGSYGDVELVRAVRDVLGGTRLWYGGGIRDAAGLEEMEAVADTVVVGNAVYEEECAIFT